MYKREGFGLALIQGRDVFSTLASHGTHSTAVRAVTDVPLLRPGHGNRWILHVHLGLVVLFMG